MIKITLIAFSLVFFSCANTNNHSMSHVSGSELIGGSYVMQDFNGNEVTEKTYQGQYQLVFFGFTNCQTVCPIGLSTMGRALHKLPQAMSKQIQPIFVTVDPDRDTNGVLKKFLPSFDKRLIGLRGTQAQLDHMINKFRGYYGKIAGNGDDYSFDHSDIIYLMGKKGEYLAHFSSSTENALIADKIKNIINKNK